jgi:GTP-dependent phosphoenolpyruvate carboxykinase
MSVQTFLHLEALEHVKQDLATYRDKLKQLVELDVEKAKADLQAVVAHFEAEFARLRSLVDSKVLAHLDEGQHPAAAVKLAAASAPTRAETASKILSEQNGTVAV